jgi:hypothetical protein
MVRDSQAVGGLQKARRKERAPADDAREAERSQVL